MKFVRLYTKFNTPSTQVNLGDCIQMLGVERIYQHLQIPESDIISISSDEIYSYDGETAILPMVGAAFPSMVFPRLPVGNKIIPKFVSTHFPVSSIPQSDIDYLKSVEPIGCRDEYSMNILKQHGVDAYISGCVTITMKKREVVPVRKKIFLVEVPNNFEDYIPSEVLENSEKITHAYWSEKPANTFVEAMKIRAEAENILSRYRDEATLVISSRLHAVAPCIAMGVPAILLTENISKRFSWIDRYIPIYSSDCIPGIDWNPDIVNYETEKSMILDMFANSIIGESNRLLQKNVSAYYEQRKRHKYGTRYHSLIGALEGKLSPEFEYVIWGAGLIGEETYRVVNEVFPKSKLRAVVDEYKKGLFHGIIIEKSDKLCKHVDVFVFLANYSGRKEGYEMMKQLGMKEGVDFLYVGSTAG